MACSVSCRTASPSTYWPTSTRARSSCPPSPPGASRPRRPSGWANANGRSSCPSWSGASDRCSPIRGLPAPPFWQIRWAPGCWGRCWSARPSWPPRQFSPTPSVSSCLRVMCCTISSTPSPPAAEVCGRSIWCTPSSATWWRWSRRSNSAFGATFGGRTTTSTPPSCRARLLWCSAVTTPWPTPTTSVRRWRSSRETRTRTASQPG
mmetsp:Transcript_1389/g.4440  ORF Transcript_1389/g.4440 Transcript_1389/m.4440 type:complete len:206 (+) Transcript_1389:946-1563(+)